MSNSPIRPINKPLQPKTSASKSPAVTSMQAYLPLGFRPLYLERVGWALMATGLWIDALSMIAGTLAELAFFSLVSGAMLRAVVLSNRCRNYAVTGLLVGLTGNDTPCQLTAQVASPYRTPTKGLLCA